MRTVIPIFLGLILLSGSVFATTPKDFRVETASDLLHLCSVTPSDPHYVAALHFCHGFATGAYHYYKVEALATPGHKFLCEPSPPPSRTSVIKDFVRWMNSNPQYQEGEAVDAIFRYLGETYPCNH